MMRKKMLKKTDGMILVMVLWILGLLSVFALSIGVSVRSKIGLISRLEKREKIFHVAKAGVEFCRGVLSNIPVPSSEPEAVSFKSLIHNSPALFEKIPTREGAAQASYMNYDYGLTRPVRMYGLDDELSKLNINKASMEEMRRLFQVTAGLTEEVAEDLANAVIDWRIEMDREIAGFYGEEYYQNLNYPYEPKKADFEVLEEVLLIKGMNPDIYDRIKDFITVYGDGIVNINTASMPVLLALGLAENIALTVVSGRNGKDMLPATEDDRIFRDDGVSLRLEFLGLKPAQLAQIDQLYSNKKISTVSNLYRLSIHAGLSGTTEKRFIVCVINHTDGRIFSWREN